MTAYIIIFIAFYFTVSIQYMYNALCISLTSPHIYFIVCDLLRIHVYATALSADSPKGSPLYFIFGAFQSSILDGIPTC